MSFLDDLNPKQREAATYARGPLLILAGAGSGKTRCLTYRFAYLVRRLDLDPGRVLAITFTNKAAREMRERIEGLLGPALGGGVVGRKGRRPVGHALADLWISTFHSACARLLRQYGGRVGLGRNFVIYDEDDQASLMKQVVGELGWDETRWPPAAMLAAVGRAKDELIGPDELAARARDFREERAVRAYARYQERLAANNAVDFDDLIFKAVVLLRQNADVLGLLRERFVHVLIDEYQDTNHAQYIFADLLAAEHRNLCVVGDDDQSIYRWRGADLRNVLEFEKDYPDAKVIRLEQNYRSTKTILRVANELITHNVARKGKELWTENEGGDPVIYYLAADEREEAEFVAGEILAAQRRKGLPLRSFAVLYRTHAQSRAFEDVFLRRAVPYQVIGGVRFYERKEIKDVLAYLRVVHNPADEVSLERALGVPKRGVGPTTLARLREVAAGLQAPEPASEPASGPVSGPTGLLRAIRTVARGGVETPGLGPKLRRDLDHFVSLVDGLAAKVETTPVAEMVREVAEKSGMIEALRRERTPEAESRIENIQELATVATEYARQADDPSLPSFLEMAALLADVDVMKEGDDGVILMSAHNAKGLEFPNVFVVGLEQGLFPHSRSCEEEGGLEEERRLFYVAMTRAMRRLYLTHARVRARYGYAMPAAASMFLGELPKGDLYVASPVAHPLVTGVPGAGELCASDLAAGSIPETTSASPPPSPRYGPGERVIHPQWGEGVIVGLSRIGVRPGSPGELQVRVAFDGQGVKTILATEVSRRGR